MKQATGSARQLPVKSLAFALTLLAGLPATAGEPVWPEPAATAEAALQAPAPKRERQTRPNFRAPAATVCSDTPLLREVADPGPRRPPQLTVTGSRRTRAVADADADAGAAMEAVMAPPPSPPAPPAAPLPVMATGAAAEPALERYRSAAQPVRAPRRQPAMPVTAGVVDDNADFGSFQQFLQRHEHAAPLGRDIRVRQRLRVVDGQGRPVPDAEVAVSSAGGARMWARTDAGGQAWLHPNAFDDRDSSHYTVTVRRGGKQVTAPLRRGQKQVLELVLAGAPAPARARLDLVFMVDATGSMGDEIDKLRDSLQGIVRQIGTLPSSPDICLGLVTYRDRGDEYFVRSWDLTGNVAAFQQVLDGVRANGGGDYPEAMNEAFDHAVQALGWRGPGTTRLLVALADAPPQMGYPPPRYDATMLAALGKGIKVLSVAASGQDTLGEIVQRQIAQYTGGRFIFLTYQDAADPGSGPGSQTVHEVANYSVDTLDQLVVRLVREELAQLPAPR
jgi:Mg-chelatase subunit ChlD